MVSVPRTGQAPPKLDRDEFGRRFRNSFVDPAFDKVRGELIKVEEIAWDNYRESHKAPYKERAGSGYVNPDYQLSSEWRATSQKLALAELQQKDPASPSRALLICCSARNDGSCPSEISKTWRMVQLAREVLERENIATDILDLSLLTSSYDKHIHPCKGCVSTAMPLCHWPCSCYPNHALHQTNDWMAEIYERWVSAHGVIIVTPVYWYQVPSPLKLMMDRLVCADGGNPDPTSTDGKNPEKAKAMELRGWDYPKHLAGRTYGLVVHGDVAGIEGVRRSLSDWLDWMGLSEAGHSSRLDRYIGYYESYAQSHDVFDRDMAMQEEVRNVARSVAMAIKKLRSGFLQSPDESLPRPRPK